MAVERLYPYARRRRRERVAEEYPLEELAITEEYPRVGSEMAKEYPREELAM